jgi:hypothetical protein
MRKVFAALAVVAVAGLAVAAELKSGPQTGEKVPGPFHPLNVNGEKAGQKNCLYCCNGDHPVAMVFARTAECPQTAKLIKKLDEATKANAKAEMGSFCVFLTDDDKAADKLKTWTDKEKIKELIVAVDNPSGPSKYNVAKEADLTVVLYVDHTVKANWSFEKGKITDENIDSIIKDLSKILPEKK